jgi:pimeloyl-ACP methyl ester carboxylesterase
MEERKMALVQRTRDAESREAGALRAPSGVRLSYDSFGTGPPLVLVHGSFSDHRANWEFVAPSLAQDFTIYAIARRGRSGSDATQGHGVVDEAHDVAAMIDSIGDPVFLIGHSYGAQVALAAAAERPDQVRKLILYEPPWPDTADALGSQLESLAEAKDWDRFAGTFFRHVLSVPESELQSLRVSGLWPPIVADAKPTLGDLRAMTGYDFKPERFHSLSMPVMLQIGTESPASAFATDALAEVLSDVRIDPLPGQGHDGMITGPEQYVASVRRFLLS